jgi:hypothetical protein
LIYTSEESKTNIRSDPGNEVAAVYSSSTFFLVLTEERTAQRMTETIEEIAPELLAEANKPLPLFILSRESFQMAETPDQRTEH